jgi:hypothetical protein
VLAPGRGKTKTGRLWVYLRDERPHGGIGPSAVLYRYTPDRKGEHPRAHLATFRGFLQADGYSGFAALYEATGGKPPPAAEVACWAHARRKFFDIHAATGAPLAAEALARIGRLFEIEREIYGRPPDERRRVRQARARPARDELAGFLDAALAKLSAKSELAGAIRYARSRWQALGRYLDDGRLEISNNAAERAIRPLATRRSLCPPCSSIWEHWKLVLWIGATRATCSGDRVDDPLVAKVGSADLIGRAGHDLFSGKDAVLDEAADAMVRDVERHSSFGHRQPFTVLVGRAVGTDPMHAPQRADAMCGPGFSLTGRHPQPVQRRGDVRIRPSRRHASHHRERLFGGAAAMLAGLRLADSQLRVLAASPMDRQNDFPNRLVDIGNDLGDKGAEQPLTGAHGHARRVPCGIKIVGQPSEVGRRGDRTRRQRRLQSRLAGLDATERRLPALLELRGDQAIVGVARSVAPFRERGFIPRLLQLEFHDALLFTSTFHVSPFCLHCGLDRHRLDRVEKLSGDRGVDTQAAEGEAPRQPEHQVRPIATIDGPSRRTARVAHHQTPPATAAA